MLVDVVVGRELGQRAQPAMRRQLRFFADLFILRVLVQAGIQRLGRPHHRDSLHLVGDEVILQRRRLLLVLPVIAVRFKLLKVAHAVFRPSIIALVAAVEIVSFVVYSI